MIAAPAGPVAGQAAWGRLAAELAALAALLAFVLWLGEGLASFRVLGLLRDDGEFVAYAKALLAGLGYVDPSMPGAPPAARFPIGFPALVAGLIAGVPAWPDQLARLGLVSPIGFVAWLALAYAVFRRVAGLAAPWALALTALLALDSDLFIMMVVLNSDVPFAALGLAAVLALDGPLRREAPVPAWRWAAGGVLVAAACLVRTAGLGLLAGVAWAAWRHGKLRPAMPALGLPVLALGAWAAFRLAAGGQSYGDVWRETLPRNAAEWAGSAWIVATKLVGNALPELLAPGLLEGETATQLFLGVLASAAVVVGAARWLWRPTAPGTPGSALGPAYLAATAAIACGWAVSFHHIEENLLTRILFPVAPFVPLAAAFGLRGLLTPAALPAWLPPARLAAVALAVALAGTSIHLRPPLASLADVAPQRATLAAWDEMFAAVRARTPADATLASTYGVALWLHTGRQGFTLPYYQVGRDLGAIPPDRALQWLAERPITHLVALPAVRGEANHTATMINPILQRWPGVLGLTWLGKRGDFAIFEVDRKALLAACRELGLAVRPIAP